VYVRPSANGHHGIVGFVGVPPACGYGDDMLAGTTALLATTGIRQIADDASRRSRLLKIKLGKLRFVR
jgi:hypothetical protein